MIETNSVSELIKIDNNILIIEDILNNYISMSKSRIKNIFIKKKINKLRREILSYYEDNNLNMLNCEDIINFCNFVRFCEKILLYNNDINKMLFVDSELFPDNSEHRLVIQKEDFKIYIKRFIQKDEITNRSFNVLVIKVIHNTGKKMTNEFTIVDDYIKYNTDSDKLLLLQISTLLRTYMKSITEEILSNLDSVYSKKKEKNNAQ